MGISGLLPLLKSIVNDVHISAYAGQVVAIDSYCWLHRATYTCSTELCLGVPTDKYIKYCMRFVQLLLHHNIKPILVFDGDALPEKKQTERKRRSARAKHKSKGLVLYKEGNLVAANKCFQKAVDVTPEMAAALIKRLRVQCPEVQCIVAPYEADAQLAYLSRQGHVAAVISEDSDLLVFGTQKVLYKMDKHGHGKEVQLRNFGAVRPLSFENWNLARLQTMAVLAGCDYLPSLPGMGLKKAHAFVKRYKTEDKVLRQLRLYGRPKLPATYARDFQLALATFRHQRVFDPVARCLVHLQPVNIDFHQRFPDSDFLGPSVPADKAQGVAEGVLHPSTKLPFGLSPAPLPTSPLSLPTHHIDETNVSTCSHQLPPSSPSSTNLRPDSPIRAWQGRGQSEDATRAHTPQTPQLQQQEQSAQDIRTPPSRRRSRARARPQAEFELSSKSFPAALRNGDSGNHSAVSKGNWAHTSEVEVVSSFFASCANSAVRRGFKPPRSLNKRSTEPSGTVELIELDLDLNSAKDSTHSAPNPTTREGPDHASKSEDADEGHKRKRAKQKQPSGREKRMHGDELRRPAHVRLAPQQTTCALLRHGAAPALQTLFKQQQEADADKARAVKIRKQGTKSRSAGKENHDNITAVTCSARAQRNPQPSEDQQRPGKKGKNIKKVTNIGGMRKLVSPLVSARSRITLRRNAGEVGFLRLAEAPDHKDNRTRGQTKPENSRIHKEDRNDRPSTTNGTQNKRASRRHPRDDIAERAGGNVETDRDRWKHGSADADLTEQQGAGVRDRVGVIDVEEYLRGEDVREVSSPAVHRPGEYSRQSDAHHTRTPQPRRLQNQPRAESPRSPALSPSNRVQSAISTSPSSSPSLAHFVMDPREEPLSPAYPLHRRRHRHDSRPDGSARVAPPQRRQHHNRANDANLTHTSPSSRVNSDCPDDAPAHARAREIISLIDDDDGEHGETPSTSTTFSPASSFHTAQHPTSFAASSPPPSPSFGPTRPVTSLGDPVQQLIEKRSQLLLERLKRAPTRGTTRLAPSPVASERIASVLESFDEWVGTPLVVLA